MAKTVIYGKKVLFSISWAEKGESLLWNVEQDGFTYHHFFQVGYVTSKDLFGYQLTIGPLLFSLVWPVL